MSMVSGNVDEIIKRIEALKTRVIREEDEEDYKNWIGGILLSAIAVLKVAR